MSGKRKTRSNNKNNNNKSKKQKTKKSIRFHSNAKQNNGSSGRVPVPYSQSHVFPYINNNLRRNNLWSTYKNKKNAITNTHLSMVDPFRRNEEMYIRRQKNMRAMQLPPTHAHLTAMDPSEFAHLKGRWIEHNIATK